MVKTSLSSKDIHGFLAVLSNEKMQESVTEKSSKYTIKNENLSLGDTTIVKLLSRVEYLLGSLEVIRWTPGGKIWKMPLH